MQIKLSLAVCDGTVESDAQTLLTLELDSQPSIETLGLSLANGKAALAQLQAQVVKCQVELMSTGQRRCDVCDRNRTVKDYHDVHYRSLFGRVVVRVPRWRRCACSVGAEVAGRRRWVSAELEYVQSRLAATIPYAKSAELLELLLPVTAANAPSTVREHALGVGRRLDAQGLEDPPAGEQVASKSNVTTVGLDGGYLRLCHPEEEKSFEVIAGRAMRSGVGQRSVAFVRAVDPHSHARVRGVLAAFGGPDLPMEVFTDGDIQLRQWQLSTLPRARHILDWYHLRRRVDKLNAVVHGRPTASQLRSADHDWLSRLAGGLKWRLWHGRPQEAMRRMAVMLYVLGKSTVCRKPAARQIRKLTLELLGYLRNNSDSLPNYGQRYRAGRRISSAFVESTVNQLIDKRMSKSQQMRWDPRSAHLLLQVRVRVIDGQLRDDFARWYPGFPSNDPTLLLSA
jgi:hypothetical protein